MFCLPTVKSGIVPDLKDYPSNQGLKNIPQKRGCQLLNEFKALKL